MKSVALYGFAPATREGVWQSKADEVWSIVWAYKYDIPRLDRIIEMHPIWMQARSQKPEYVKAREHYAWLKANTQIPVYMLMDRPEIPMCISYPIKGVQALVPEARRRKVFTSSFDYLMGLAIYEGFDRIEAYGFDMGSDTEYRYQREGAAYWIGFCDKLGIEFVLPENTRLLSGRMYGYEGGSMIYRQDLERMRTTRDKQKREAFARLNNIEGRMQILADSVNDLSGRLSEADPDEAAVIVAALEKSRSDYNEVKATWDSQYRLCLVISGALQECEYYLKEIDLEEPSEELLDPIGFIPMDTKANG